MVAVNGIYRLAVIGTVAGQQHVHTLHFRSTLDPDSLSASEEQWQQELIDAWQGAPRTAYRGIFYTVHNPCEQYQVRKVCGSLPLPAGVDEAEAGGSTAGTMPGGSSITAPWLAQNVTWRTGNAGRSYRGRSYIGGLDENDITGAVVAPARVTLLATYCTALKTAFVDPGDLDTPYKLFVFSRVLAEGKPATPDKPAVPPVECQQAGADVRSFQTRTALATMKSRKAGSGV